MNGASSQAGLASYIQSRQHLGHLGILAGMAAPVKVCAAIIEWPDALSDTPPALILTRSEGERDSRIAAEIQGMADALTGDEWRAAIDRTNAPLDWRAWLDELEETTYGWPWVTTYTREV